MARPPPWIFPKLCHKLRLPSMLPTGEGTAVTISFSAAIVGTSSCPDCAGWAGALLLGWGEAAGALPAVGAAAGVEELDDAPQAKRSAVPARLLARPSKCRRVNDAAEIIPSLLTTSGLPRSRPVLFELLYPTRSMPALPSSASEVHDR